MMKTPYILLLLAMFFSLAGKSQTPTDSVGNQITPELVLQRYIEAIGGEKRLKKLKNYEIKMRTKVNGKVYNIRKVYKAPDKFIKTMSSGGVIIEEKIYDGKHGLLRNVQGERYLQAQELEDLQREALMFVEQDYSKINFVTFLSPKFEVIDNRDAYEVEIVSPSGTHYFDYFDRSNSFKVATFEETVENQDTLRNIVDYKNYREVDKIYFPHKIIHTFSAGKVVFTVTSIETNIKLDRSLFSTDKQQDQQQANQQQDAETAETEQKEDPTRQYKERPKPPKEKKKRFRLFGPKKPKLDKVKKSKKQKRAEKKQK